MQNVRIFGGYDCFSNGLHHQARHRVISIPFYRVCSRYSFELEVLELIAALPYFLIIGSCPLVTG